MHVTKRGPSVPSPHYRSTGVNSKLPWLARSRTIAFVVAAVAVTITMPGSGRAPVETGSHTTIVAASQAGAGWLASHLRVTLVSLPVLKVHHEAARVVARPLSYLVSPARTNAYVVSLIHSTFPRTAWRDAEAVAWCESKYRPLDIAYDSNGTHDRGVFQLNDGGTEQYLLERLGLNPNNLSLAFNPVLNIRAAALLFARDGWSQWSCASAL